MHQNNDGKNVNKIHANKSDRLHGRLRPSSPSTSYASLIWGHAEKTKYQNLSNVMARVVKKVEKLKSCETNAACEEVILGETLYQYEVV